MLIIPDEVVTGVLVNAIAVVGRQISAAASGLRKTDDDLTIARWFETFRLTGSLPDLPDLSQTSVERLVAALSGADVQAALQELLAVRLTDAPETDASRARDAVRVALNISSPDADGFAVALADYYDDQICALVARLEGADPPLLAQIRGEAFSARIISVLRAIERNTAAPAGHDEQRRDHDREAGRLLTEVTDPFALEVHRPVHADDPTPGLALLPTYVPREHDRQLAEVVLAAAEGASGVAVLVGGSSTGKTRACWEALGLLRERPERWRLWHPIDPSRPEAALRDLPAIGPRTVIWLNEAQFYLDAVGGLGERVAAGLRELLRDPARAPVLVLATLWPEFWARLTARPPAGADDPHAQARELLAGWDIAVPAAFSAAQMPLLSAAGDPRLALAADVAEDGRVIQFLAGAPELVARYRNATSAAAALISAAMDARRLGMGIALPLAFLEAAAPGYLADTDWDALPEDWLEQALAYTAAPCNGVRGPLARIRSRYVAPAPEPAYRLADYLEQHGRHARRQDIPPTSFWAAAQRFASSGEMPALAKAAEDRGLLRDAARLRKHTTELGDTFQAAELIKLWYSVHSHSPGPNPAQWAAAHVFLDNPRGVALLLDALRRAGAAEQASALLARDPAAHVCLDDPGGVAWLLDVMREAGAAEQATALARRAAAHAPLDDPRGVALLLDASRRAGAAEQAAALLARDPAAHVPLGNWRGVARLLVALREAGAAEQAAALGRRAAAGTPLDDPHDVALLLNHLWRAGAVEQAAALLARDPAARVSLDDTGGVALLLSDLWRAGAVEQATALARRAAVGTPLDNPNDVVRLLNVLRWAGAAEQAAALADRAAAHAPLDSPNGVARLLNDLRTAGAAEQAAALLARDPADRVSLDNPIGIVSLLNDLWRAGAAEQAATLGRRAAAHAPLDNPNDIEALLGALEGAGAAEQAAALARRAAAHAPLDNPARIARMLDVLRWEGAAEPAAVLLARDPAAYVSLDDPNDIASLLYALRGAGAAEQAAVLARRAAAHAPLDSPAQVASLLDALRTAEAAEQAAALLTRDPAAHVSRENLVYVASLLDALRTAGAVEQAAVLARRAAAHAPLDNLYGVARLLDALRTAEAAEQAAVLARRAAAHAPLDNPAQVASLLDALQRAEAAEQAAVLARRAAAHVPLDHGADVAHLLNVMRRAGAAEQVRTLADRLPAEGHFDLFRQQAGRQMPYRFGREGDGSPAPPWSWSDLD